MMRIRQYVKVKSLAEAYELNQKNGRILGGMLWMKLGQSSVGTAIDLSGLGLDQIEETEEGFSIGCMTSLRQLEEHEGFNRYTEGAVRESVRSIIGVQFRNLATVGGSIFGRFGFSDVLTCFLALDTQVELYQEGIVPLREFAGRPRSRKETDILVRLLVKKRPAHFAYLSHRNTKTDFPVLTCAVSLFSEEGRVVVGARPQRAIACSFSREEYQQAKTSEEAVKTFSECLSRQFPTGSNLRGGAEYRSHLAAVLIRRGIKQLMEKEEGCK